MNMQMLYSVVKQDVQINYVILGKYAQIKNVYFPIDKSSIL